MNFHMHHTTLKMCYYVTSVNNSLCIIFVEFPTTQPGILGTSPRPTACVKAVWRALMGRRATSTAAHQFTCRLSFWTALGPAWGAATPTLRATYPSRLDAPVCRCWRKIETHRAVTRAWRELRPKLGNWLLTKMDRVKLCRQKRVQLFLSTGHKCELYYLTMGPRLIQISSFWHGTINSHTV